MKKITILGAALQLLFLVSCSNPPKPKEADVAPTATEDRDPTIRPQEYDNGGEHHRADTMDPKKDPNAAGAVKNDK